MTRGGGPHDRLDVPLVWDLGAQPDSSLQDQAQASDRRVQGHPRLRLIAAAPLDIAFVLTCLGLVWVTALWFGAGGNEAQATAVVPVGLELAAVIGLGCLWAWRGTPGMLVCSVVFAEPLSFRRAVGWLVVWSAAIWLLGLPLVVGPRGGSLAERLAGSDLRPRSPHVNA